MPKEDLSFLPDKKEDLSFLPDKKEDLSFLPDKKESQIISATKNAFNAVKDQVSSTLRVIHGDPKAVFDTNAAIEQQGPAAREMLKNAAINNPVLKERIYPGEPIKTVVANIPRIATETVIEGIPATPTEAGIGMAMGGLFGKVPKLIPEGSFLKKVIPGTAKKPEPVSTVKFTPPEIKAANVEEAKAMVEKMGGEFFGTQEGAAGKPGWIVIKNPNNPNAEKYIPINEVTESRIAKELGKLPNTVGERGFIKQVKEDVLTPEQVKSQLDGTYEIRNTKQLRDNAAKLVATDINAAKSLVANSTKDDAVATAIELQMHYRRLGDFDSEIAVVEDIAQRLTEAGRFSQAASIYNNLSPQSVIRTAVKKIEQANTERPYLKLKLTKEQADELYKMSEKIEKMNPGYDRNLAMYKLTRNINELVPSTTTDKLTSMLRAGLLTGMKTSEVNIFSNSVKGAYEIASDVPAYVIDKALSLFSGKQHIGLTSKGYVEGFVKGIQKGWNFLKTGYDERNALDKLDYKQVNFKTPIGKYVDFVYRFIGAQDQPFYYGANQRSLYSQAISKANNRKLTGPARKEFIKKMVSEPDEEMQQLAHEDALISVYQNKTMMGEAATKAGQALNSWGPAGKLLDVLVMAFKKTPAAVVTDTVAGSIVNPVKMGNELYKGIRYGNFDQRAFAKLGGKAAVSDAIVYAGYKLYDSGIVTLAPPKSEKEKAQWKLEGKKPFSVKINGEYKSLVAFGSMGQMLLLGSSFAEGVKDTGSFSGGLLRALGRAGQSQIEQPMLQGIKNVVESLQDPERKMANFAARTAGSIVPTIVADTARAIDGTERITKDRTIQGSISSGFQSRIPGLRTNLQPELDTFGQEVKTPSPLEVMADLFRSSDVRNANDPTVKELSRLMATDNTATPALLDRKQKVGDTEVQLTLEQLTELQKTVGMQTKNAYTNIMRLPTYARADDLQKKQMLETTYNLIRKVNMIKMAKKEGLVDKAALLLDAIELPSDVKKTIARVVMPEKMSSKKIKESIIIKAYRNGKNP